MYRSILSALVLCLILGSACDPDRVYEENTRIPGRAWEKDMLLRFETAVEDTLHLHNIHINIRNSNSYAFSNLFLFITTTAPSGDSLRDTLECNLADERGRWYGTGLGDIYYLRVPFKRNVIFPMSGTYRFEIRHAMRTDRLEGIMDVGVRIERSVQTGG